MQALSPLPIAARPLSPFASALTLRLRIIAMVAAGFVCATALGVAVLWHLKHDAERAATSQAVLLAATLADQLVYLNSRQAMVSLNQRTGRMQSLLDFVHAREDRDLEVVGADTTIVADSDHGDIGVRLSGEPGTAVSATLKDGQPRDYVEAANDGKTSYHVAVAMTGADGRTVGALGYDYTRLRNDAGAQTWRATQRFAYIVLPLAGLILLLTLRGMRPILRTIVRLSEAARAIGAGDRSHRIRSLRSDELGDLARAFDGMADRLVTSEAKLLAEIEERRAAEDALHETNEALEGRVTDRTASLARANELLRSELHQRERAEQQLEYTARFDALTGLPNRAAFARQLEAALARARPAGTRVAMLFLDLDRFKSINDAFGHNLGDRVLQEVAARLRMLAPASDIVYRLAGDEFTLIAEETAQRRDFGVLAEQLVVGFHEPLRLDHGQRVHVSLSIGVAVSPADGDSVADLMRRADFAMYDVKGDGRDGYRLHTARMSDEAGTRLSIEHALRDALAQNEFSLHFQPRVSAESRCLVGMEALLRWESRSLGRVPPDTFIPVAEESGLIAGIGDWVIRSTLAQFASWKREGLRPGVIAINVSAAQLRRDGFPEQVLSSAMAEGLSPAEVELELTESMLVADPEGAAVLLGRLRKYGFGVAIDDFGKGHSSLTHLKQFPITTLKIDRAFVTHIANSQTDLAIASSIVALGKALRVRVTAEGVETLEQLKMLSDLDCDEYQGYLFGRPVDVVQMTRVLQESAMVQEAVVSELGATEAL